MAQIRSRAHFQETQPFPRLILFGTIAGGIVGAWIIITAAVPHASIGIKIAIGCAIALFTGFNIGNAAMRTTVDEDFVTVTVGRFLPASRRRIRVSEITSAEIIPIFPISLYYQDLGGSSNHLKAGGRTLAFGNNRGVRLTLQNGRKYVIASQRPEELLAALGQG